MIATIVKNSTSVTLINDWNYRFRRDGGFDTVEIHFYSTDPDLLNRWDRISFNGRTWRVAEQPNVKINFETSADWLYTVTLIESSAILRGIPMPNITYTQNLAKTRTLVDAINTALLKQSVRLYSEAPKYTLASTTGLTISDASKLAPNDKLEGKTLYDILKYYGEYVDAKPLLNESTNEIYFEYFNEDYGLSLAPIFTEIEKSKSIEEYATDIIEDVQNAYIESPLSSNYPHRLAKTFYIPADLASNMSFENMKIELPFKIKNVIEMIMEVGTSGAIVLRSEPNPPLITEKFIYQKKEWETLPKDSFWSFTQFADWGQIRNNCVYYEYGGNTIENLKALDYHATQAGYSITGPHEIKVRVVYEALPDVELDKSTETILDGDIYYVERLQQQSSTVDLKAEEAKLESSLRNMQSSFYNVMWVQNTLPDVRSRVTCMGDSCLITNMSAKWTGEVYEVNAKLATEYNKKNKLTQPINENRIFEIPTTQTTVRKVVQKLKAKIGLLLDGFPNTITGAWADFNYNILFGFQGDTAGLTNMYELDPLMVFAEFEYLDSETYVSVALPHTTVLSENTIIIISRMTNNTSADWQRLIDANPPINYTASSAIVTDKNGENKTVKLKYIAIAGEDIITYNNGADVPFIETFPFVSNQFFDNGTMISPITKKYDYELHSRIALYKDSREQLQFENQIIVSAENCAIDYEQLFKNSMFGDVPNTPKIRLIINATTYELNVTGNITFYEGYMKVTFTYPTTGTLSDIYLTNNNDILIRKIVTKSVTIGTSGYITIYVKEE